MGMAHRGRLNVLANIVGKSYDQIFKEFEGYVDPESTQGSGDVKYHLGQTGKFTSRTGRTVTIELAANPSHLETVDPVVVGMVRAKQDRINEPESFSVLPLLVHGDAAFAGQGVVAETLNCSTIKGYRVGGTIHLIINNQLGFTTPPDSARSSEYATDVAKMIEAPIFHVNGDDPEACVRVARLAYAFRKTFHKDVVIDMVCYRRHGHNEGDDPSYTQPLMYKRIDARRSVRKLYTEALVKRGDISHRGGREGARRLPGPAPDRARRDPRQEARGRRPRQADAAGRRRAAPRRHRREPRRPDAGVRHACRRCPTGSPSTPSWPSSSRPARRWSRAARSTGPPPRRWRSVRCCSTASTSASPARTPVGARSPSGTPCWPTTRTAASTPRSPTSTPTRASSSSTTRCSREYAAVGFEYGYSVENKDAFVAWEAQFGDFINGAESVVDEYLVAAEDKWGQTSGLVLLLPHGFEGQGPDHSSGRIERFLTLCAEDNIQVANATTPAQYFHLLRRQMAREVRKPLIVFTPKSLLRAKVARSPIDELTAGSFRELLDDPSVTDKESVQRLVLCSGKVAYDAIARRDEKAYPAAIVRVEQLYPFPYDQIRDLLASYPNVTEVVWLQEEPDNMGPRAFVAERLWPLVPEGIGFRQVSRSGSGSPATGSHAIHVQEQADIVDRTFEGL